jgi:hypothetical protein
MKTSEWEDNWLFRLKNVKNKLHLLFIIVEQKDSFNWETEKSNLECAWFSTAFCSLKC